MMLTCFKFTQIILASGILISGCTAIGPKYEQPNPEDLSNDTTNFEFRDGYDTAAPNAAWWEAFGDPQLTDIISSSITHNRTLQIAAANLSSTRAAQRIAKANRLPTDRFSANYQETRASAVQLAGVGIGADAIEPNDNVDFTNIGIAAGWELDLFGRVGRLIEIATADVGAAAAALADLHSIIAADVADTYILLRGLQTQRSVAYQNIENLSRTLELVAEQRLVGRVTRLDVEQATAQLRISEAVIPSLDAALAETANQLSSLAGKPPAFGISLLKQDRPLPIATGDISIGDPAALLRRRPDIKAAERQLAAATAGIGLNISEAFPRIDLLGNAGIRAIGVESLFAPPALNFAVGPQLSWSVTDLIRARDRVQGATAATAAAFANYEQTVLNALAETETALAAQANLRKRHTTLKAAETSARAAADLARMRYEAGRVNFLQVLDTERVALTTANDVAAAHTDIARAQVAVFRALRLGAPLSSNLYN
ncbi:MAG: efflux transporter outer membrane subunit [Pseudomonadota bacterium]